MRVCHFLRNNENKSVNNQFEVFQISHIHFNVIHIISDTQLSNRK